MGRAKKRVEGGRGKAGERRGEYQALPCVVQFSRSQYTLLVLTT